MPGMDFDPVARRQSRRIRQTAQFDRLRFALELGIAPGVQLHHRRAQANRRVDLPRIGFDEQRDADACLAQRRHQRCQRGELPRRIEPALGGPLLALFGHDARGVGAVPQGDRQHLVGRRHFQVERDRQFG
ncbi:hypothetical protein D9M73_274140 [compost metagenome]